MVDFLLFLFFRVVPSFFFASLPLSLLLRIKRSYTPRRLKRRPVQGSVDGIGAIVPGTAESGKFYFADVDIRHITRRIIFEFRQRDREHDCIQSMNDTPC